MADSNISENNFLNQLTAIVEQNISNEQFGVSELADSMNMSRSNLLRKVKKETKLSVSQLINQVRLSRAMELLRKSALNVSEVSHQVGFASVSYFIKCFREYYGYPPGEVGRRKESELVPRNIAAPPGGPSKRNRNIVIVSLLGLTAIGVAGWFLYWKPVSQNNLVEKSIAVLPFKNDSNDSTNLYLINGLMESTLNNLQKIKDLKVISRTSTEKYRTTAKSIPEMAEELNVNYFVEGSGQKIGDRILLNIQLIDASTDRHLWAKQYRREVKDIFELQQEIARNIAEEIQVLITPEEKQRIEKVYTDNLEAYDLFLKGLDLVSLRNNESLEKGISYFKKAIELDPKFAIAHAEIAISYYNLDLFQAEKKYGDQISTYADKALLYDPKLGESLMAKALDYINQKEYESAEPYLEKALEYHPNSSQVVGFLTDYYATYNLNTGKYLQYALLGLQLDIVSQDSVAASYTYLRLANALIQTGFVDEALMYIDKSLVFNPANPFSRYVRAFILYAKTGNLKQTQDILIKEYAKDSARFDILQDIGKVTYYIKDFESAYTYYKRFLKIRETQHLDVYHHEDMIIGVTLAKVGLQKQSEELINSYKRWLDNDRSIYKNLGLAVYNIYKENHQEAFKYFELFTQEDNVQYWVILFMEDDPILEPIKDNPEFKKHMDKIKARFWENHERLKTTLIEKGLLLEKK